MSFKESLENLMKESGTSNVGLAKAIGVTDSSIIRWKRGEAVPSLDNAISIAEFFGIKLSELVDDSKIAEPKTRIRIPVIGSVSKWGIYTNDIWAENYITIDLPDLHEYPREECYSLVVRDDSLLPEYAPNLSYLIFHQQKQCADGDWVIYREMKSKELQYAIFKWTTTGIELQAPGLKANAYRKQDINRVEILAVLIDVYNDL